VSGVVLAISTWLISSGACGGGRSRWRGWRQIVRDRVVVFLLGGERWHLRRSAADGLDVDVGELDVFDEMAGCQ